MGLFEDTVVKAKDVFDVAAKKTNEVIEIQKLKLKVSQLNSQISKEFETLGRLYFDSVKTESEINGEAEAIVTSITEKQNEVEELEVEIDAQKRVAVCPTCGSKNLNEAVFCCTCGNKLK